MALTLKRNFGFAILGNLTYAASQYIVLLIFIKLYSVEDVGMFIYAGAFTTPLMMALEMQLRNFYITDRKDRFQFNEYFSFRLGANALGVISLTVGAILIKPEYFTIIFIVILIKVLESQLDLIYGAYQKAQRLDYVFYSRIVRGAISVVMVASISLIFNRIEYSLIAYLLSWTVLYFGYERRVAVRRRFVKPSEMKITKIESTKLKVLLGMCIPMFISILVDKFYISYPRLSVENNFGIKILGIFGSLLYFKALGGQFISALAQAAVPRLSALIAEGNLRNFKRLIAKMILVGLSTGLFFTLISFLGGKPLLRFVYAEEYAVYSDVLTFILVGATVSFSYIFLGTALTCLRKQWIKLPISVLSFTLLVILISYQSIATLMDIVMIILMVEVFTFFVYCGAYAYFMRKQLNFR